jgi:hypothetical protein
MGQGDFGITKHAKRQLAQKLQIPAVYFDRLADNYPDLLATNVNELFKRDQKRQMIRTLDGDVRAIVSDRYRVLDNYDFAEAVLPVMNEKGVEIVSCDITETKLYIKCLAPWLDREVEMPEGLKMGVGHNIFLRKVIGAMTISNSEVGAGGVSIAPSIFERQCTNLATFRSEGYGRMHIGKKHNGDESVTEYLSDDTRKLDDAAVWSRARDVVAATLDGRVIDNIIKKMADARGNPIEGDPAKVVEVFGKKHGMTEGERGGLLKHLVGSGEMTQYGMQWAVTRLAGEAEDYDRASDLERLGGQVIELARSDWQQLAMAA